MSDHNLDPAEIARILGVPLDEISDPTTGTGDVDEHQALDELVDELVPAADPGPMSTEWDDAGEGPRWWGGVDDSQWRRPEARA